MGWTSVPPDRFIPRERLPQAFLDPSGAASANFSSHFPPFSDPGCPALRVNLVTTVLFWSPIFFDSATPPCFTAYSVCRPCCCGVNDGVADMYVIQGRRLVPRVVVRLQNFLPCLGPSPSKLYPFSSLERGFFFQHPASGLPRPLSRRSLSFDCLSSTEAFQSQWGSSLYFPSVPLCERSPKPPSFGFPFPPAIIFFCRCVQSRLPPHSKNRSCLAVFLTFR